MKITKYPQSCVLLEYKNKRILIDPGKFVYEQTDMKPEDFKDIDILLLTHRHSDHCMPEAVKKIKENNPNMVILSNPEVGDILSKEGVNIDVVKEGDIKEFNGIKIEVVEAVHGYNVNMKDKGFPKENNGFVVDDGKLRVYHCSDTICFRNEIKADVVLVPICGNAVVMEPRVAVAFCQEINPKLVIPIHYDGPTHPQGTERFEEEIKKTNLDYKILKNKESLEV